MPGDATSNPSYRVVVSLPERDNEFQSLQTADAKSAAGRLGLDVEVTYAESNAVQQIQQLFKAIHAEQRPRAIVVEPVALEGMERVARAAARAGMGWAVLNSSSGYVDGLRREFPGVPIFAVGSDQVEIGRIQGRHLRMLIPGAGTVLYLQGPRSASAAQERLKGFQESIAGSRINTIVLDGHWAEEGAEQAVRGWLRLRTSEGTRIDVVAAQDDAMARGARRAIEAVPELAKRCAEIPFLGIDGVPEVGQKLVREGRLTATVVMPSNTGAALEAVARFLREGVVPAASIKLAVRSYPDEGELRRRLASRAREA
jgi:ABC-type sugar transport system substrate-binding protein